MCSFMRRGMVSDSALLQFDGIPSVMLTCFVGAATGTQYFHLCKILLRLYKPDTPAPGSGLRYSRAHREMGVCAKTERTRMVLHY